MEIKENRASIPTNYIKLERLVREKSINATSLEGELLDIFVDDVIEMSLDAADEKFQNQDHPLYRRLNISSDIGFILAKSEISTSICEIAKRENITLDSRFYFGKC